MKLRAFLDRLARGGISEFAGKVGVSPIYLSQLAAELGGRAPSPELCVVIERESGYLVTRQELRPNDFWKIWPDLAHLAHKVVEADGVKQLPMTHENIANAATENVAKGVARV